MKKLLIFLIVILGIACLLLKFTDFPQKLKKQEIKPVTAVAPKPKITETIAPVEKVELRVEPRRDVFKEPEILKRYREKIAKLEEQIRLLEKSKEAKKPDEVEKLKAEIAELEHKIWSLQIETEIRGLKDIKEINSQIAALKSEITVLNQKIRYLESLQYEEVHEPEVVEHHHYYRMWPYFYPYVRLCFLNLWLYYPYLGGIYGHVGWFDPYYWYRDPYYYDPYYSGYYRSGQYMGRQYGRPVVHKSQLKQRTTSRVTNYPSRSTVKATTTNSGKYASPWGDLRSLKTTSRLKTSPSYSAPARTGISRRVSSRKGIQISRSIKATKIRSSSSLRSVRTSSRTATKTKVRKK